MEECKWAVRLPIFCLLAYRWIYHRICAMPHLWLPSRPWSTATVPWLVLISYPAEGRRLSWPEWLFTYKDAILGWK